MVKQYTLIKQNELWAARCKLVGFTQNFGEPPPCRAPTTPDPPPTTQDPPPTMQERKKREETTNLPPQPPPLRRGFGCHVVDLAGGEGQPTRRGSG